MSSHALLSPRQPLAACIWLEPYSRLWEASGLAQDSAAFRFHSSENYLSPIDRRELKPEILMRIYLFQNAYMHVSISTRFLEITGMEYSHDHG